MVLFPSREQPVIGNLNGELGTSWELGTWEPTTSTKNSLGTSWELGSPQDSLVLEPKNQPGSHCYTVTRWSDGGVRANSARAFISRELGVIQPGWHEGRIWQLG